MAIELHSSRDTPSLMFISQYDVIDERKQKVQAEVDDRVNPDQFIDAAFPSV